MTEDRFKELIQGYVCEEMKLLPEYDKLSEHPSYSKGFNRKMKRIKRTAEMFGGNTGVYIAVTRTAAAILIVFSLMAANQTSAAIFGFNPWKELTRVFLSDVKMEKKTYEKNGTERSEVLQPVSDIPSYVPEGYKEVDYQEESTIIAMEWEKTNKDGTTTGLAYSRDKMSEDAVFVEDAEYDDVKNIEMAGYKAKIYYKPDRVWICWFDDHYSYMIWTSDTEKGDGILKQMAESIYQKK